MTADQALQRARDRRAVQAHNANVVIERARARARRTLTYRELLAHLSAERKATRARLVKRESTRRMWSNDGLPMARAMMKGPRWRRYFGVKEVPMIDVDPEAAKVHRPGRKLLMFTFEDDVRELVLVPIDNNRAAMWSDPREQLGL